jgi:hypothetical protein
VLALTMGCAQGDGFRHVGTTDVKGFGVSVERSEANDTSYRAQGASRRDRATFDGAYYARNVIGIRNVAGCPVKPELIRHDKEGPHTVATVVCR